VGIGCYTNPSLNATALTTARCMDRNQRLPSRSGNEIAQPMPPTTLTHGGGRCLVIETAVFFGKTVFVVECEHVGVNHWPKEAHPRCRRSFPSRGSVGQPGGHGKVRFRNRPNSLSML
jgi:hypothetical protein